MITFLLVLVLLLVLHYARVLAPIENIFIKILNPIFSSFHSSGLKIKTSLDISKEKDELLRENLEIKTQNNLLIEENVKLKNVKEENDILRDHLGFLTRNEYDYEMGNVISRGGVSDNSNIIETMMIDKGHKDGIEVGQAVVSGEGIIIGKVMSVKEGVSEVFLTNNDKCKLASTIFNEDKTSGIVEGELGLTLKMKYIPQSQVIGIDDVVVTSGLEKLIPRGLIIGKVIKTEKENNDLWQTASIEPLVDLDNLIIVSVIK